MHSRWDCEVEGGTAARAHLIFLEKVGGGWVPKEPLKIARHFNAGLFSVSPSGTQAFDQPRLFKN